MRLVLLNKIPLISEHHHLELDHRPDRESDRGALQGGRGHPPREDRPPDPRGQGRPRHLAQVARATVEEEGQDFPAQDGTQGTCGFVVWNKEALCQRQNRLHGDGTAEQER